MSNLYNLFTNIRTGYSNVLSLFCAILISGFFCAPSFGQTLYDSFADGNFTTTPTWSGSTTEYTIVANSDAAANASGSNTVRLNAPATAATRYLSSQISTWQDQQTWRFFIGRRAQAFTGTNQSYFYATSHDIRSK